MALKDWKYAGQDDNGDKYWDHRGGGWVYFYNKGMFRDREQYYVISTSLTGGSNPEDRKNISFNTNKEAIKYAKEFMRTH